jgi:hypothetical protein
MVKSIYVAMSLAAAVAFAVVSPAYSGDLYGLGQEVTYGNLVDSPDMTIQYVAYDPKGTATFSLTRGDGRLKNPPQLDLKKGESRDIYVKRECQAGTCRAYVVTLVWTYESSENRGTIEIDSTVRIIRIPYGS